MLSFANSHLSFCFLFLLVCVVSLVASAPTTTTTHNSNHRHNLHSRPFPYGKLADRLLHVNDRNYDVPYMIDNLNEDMVRVYPEKHHHHYHHSVESVPFSSSLPIASFESTKLPKVGDIKNLFSFAYQHIQKVVVQEWEAAVVWWNTVSRDQ